jgi:gliding motility-associated-like protein
MGRCKQLLQTLLFFVLTVLLWSTNIQEAKATHAMGTDLAWECVGPNRYLVTIKIYRDCNGVNLGSNATLRVTGCGQNFTVSLPRIQPPRDITPLCASATRRCNGGTGQFGVEEHIYQREVTVPANCTNIRLSTSLCCRNNAITTLNNPGGQNLYVQGILNSTVTPCNNSPQFLNLPTAFLCNGQQTFYNHGGYDPDGDSLAYSLINCLENFNDPVNYNAGFSGTNPLNAVGGPGGVTINPLNGAISFTPNGTQVGVLCVLVREFRNGVYIGETMRDIQFTVINCTNNLPFAIGVDEFGQANVTYNVTSCVGQQLCFDIRGTDIDPADSVFMAWNGAIPGASFITQNVSRDTVLGTFCWNPRITDVGSHVFTVTVRDNACPLFGQNTFTFTVNIINNPNPPVTVFSDTTICLGESATLTAVAAPPTLPTTVTSITWSPATGLNTTTGTTVIATPLASTVYTCTILYSDGCTSVDYVEVIVRNDPSVAVIPNGTNVCSGSLTTLIATTDRTGLTYQWFDPSGTPLGSGTVSGAQSTINVNVPALQDTTLCYEVIVTDPLTGCTTIEEGCLIIGPPQGPVECINIYVSPTGNPAGAGTQFDPTTIHTALRRSACNNTVIKMAQGTYNTDTTLEVTSYLTIEGGFDPGNLWLKTSQQGATTINRTNANPLGFPGAYHMIAFNANNAQGFRLQDLTITTDDADSLGMSTYGLRLAACSDYNIVRCHVRSGAAGAGLPGLPGLSGADGLDGCDGIQGTVGDAFIASGCTGGDGGGFSGFGFGGAGGAGYPAEGGDSATTASFDGGGGGGGGSGNVHAIPLPAFAGGGAGSGGIPPGVGGVPVGSVTSSPCGGGDGGGGAAGAAGNNNGANGLAGISGSNGSSAPVGTAGDPCAFFTPGIQALAGQDGIGGTGGCGGGGSSAAAPNNGGGGGGGGGGGQGGRGGTGGTGGGGSFGIYIYENGADGNVVDCNVAAASAGIGGVGGVGGSGGFGGVGGQGGFSGGNITRGGSGGNGGAGGQGGQGGTGSTGISQAIMIATCAPGTPLVTSISGFNLAGQPVITVENVNCANAPVYFTALSLPIGVPGAGVGVANWDFSVFNNFANPATGINNPDTTMYDSLGRYTIQQGAQVYTDFHNIAFDKAFKPTITSTADVLGLDTFRVCVGDFANFCSDRFADTIIWDFNGAIAQPINVQCIGSQQFNSVGCYQITLMLITDCCGDSPTDTAYLVVDPRPVVTAAVPSLDICEGETVTLTVNGLSPADTVLWTPNVNLNVISASSVEVTPSDSIVYVATVYARATCTGVERLACPVSVQFDVNVFPPIIPNLSSVDVVCTSDGSATATPAGGSGNYSFTWDNGAVGAGASHTIINLTTGVYCVTITDNIRGCDTTACIFVNPAPTILSVTSDSTRDISCFGANDGFIRVTSTGGIAPYTYLWADGTIGDTRTNLPPGTYCVTATDATPCEAVICIDVIEPDVVIINFISMDTAVCEYTNDGVIEVEGQGGTGLFTYVWDNAASTQTTGLATGLPGGSTYSVTVTDENGCSLTDAYVLPILYPVTPFAVQTATINCFGQSTASIVAGASDEIGSYLVSIAGPVSASGTQAAGALAPPVSFTNLPAGLYTVTVTDNNAGCFDTTSILITQPSLLTATAVVDDNVTCFGFNDGVATVSPVGGTAPYSFNWSNGEGTQTAGSLLAGPSTVTVTDALGCTVSASVTVTEPTQVSVTATVTSNYNGSQLTCFGATDGTANAAPSGGTPTYTFNWSNSQTTANASGLGAGTHNVTVTDANLCAVTATITVTAPAAVTATIPALTQVDVLCFGQSTGEATAVGSGGTGTYSFVWNTAPVQNTATATGLDADVHCVTVTDQNNCSASACVTITEPATAHTITANVTSNYNGAQVSCNGASDAQVNSAPIGGVGPYTFVWSNGATTEDLVNVPAGSYCVTSTDFNGCTATACVTVTQPTAVTASIPSLTQVNVLCFGQATGEATAAGAGGTGAYGFVWNTLPPQNTATATALAAGQHCVTVSDVNACTATACVTITQPATAHTTTATVTTNYNGSQISCFGSSDGAVRANPTGGVSPYTFNWSMGNLTQNVTGLPAGTTYCVTTTDANGCTASACVTLTQPSAVTATIDAASVVNVGCNAGATGSATVAGTGGTGAYTFVWTNGQTGATATGLPAGQHCVTVIDANNCQASTCVTITEPAAPLAGTAVVTSNYNGAQLSCAGATDADIEVNPTGGTAPYTYVWDNGPTTQDQIGVGAGVYCVTVTDFNGCTLTSCVTVTAPATLTATVPGAGVTNVLCFGQSTGIATAAGNGGTEPYSFVWGTTPGQFTATATGLPAGPAPVTVTDANGCTATTTVTITQPATAHTTTATVTTNYNGSQISCFGSSDGAVRANPTGGVSPYTFNWSMGNLTQNVTGLPAGTTYCVTTTDANGCTATACVTLTQPSAVTATIDAASVVNVGCNAGATGSATVAGTGGTGAYTFVWTNGQTGATATGLPAGQHCVTVIDANNCQASTCVTITEPAAPLAGTAVVTSNYNGAQLSCAGATDADIEINPTGGTGPYTYVWDNGPTTQDQIGVGAGVYCVTVTDFNGCTLTSCVTVTAPATLTATVPGAGVTNVLCFGQSTGIATAAGNGGTEPYSFVWGTTPGQFTATATGLPAGQQCVTVSDANGCTATTCVTITQPATAHTATATVTTNYNGSQISCFGSSDGAVRANPTGGVSPYTFNWSMGNLTQNVTGLPAGTSYCVTTTDANGCTASACVTLTQPSAVTATIDAASVVNVGCNAGATGSATVVGTGGTGAYTFVWTNGQTGATATGLAAGQHCVTVIDANNCQASTCVTITEPAAPLAGTAVVTSNYNGAQLSCAGATDADIEINPTGGTGPYTYVWDNGPTTQDQIGVGAGVYCVTVTDFNGCTLTSCVTVTAPATLTATVPGAGVTNVLCFGQSTGIATAAGNGGTTPYSFVWGTTPGQFTATATGLPAGPAPVTVTDANGCTATTTVTITQPATAHTTTATVTTNYNGSQISCFGSSDGAVRANPTGGVSPYTFSWSMGNLTQNVTGLPAGTTYCVTTTDANGCTATACVTLTQPSAVTATIDAASVVNVGCNAGATGSATVAGTGGTGAYTFVWTNGQTGATATGLAAGQHCVTVIDANNCQASTCVTITEPAAPLAGTAVVTSNYNGAQLSCAGATDADIEINPTGGTSPYTYVWDNGPTTQDQIGVGAGVYCVTVTDFNGCTLTSCVTVTAPATLTATVPGAGVTNVLCFGQSTGIATAAGNGGTTQYSFVWGTTPGQFTATATGLPAGPAPVTVTDANGCTATTTVTITQPATAHTATASVISNYNGSQISCFGAADGIVRATPTGGVAGYSFQWSTSANTQNVSFLLAGVYTVTTTDANGCTATAAVTLTQPSSVTATIAGQSDVNCFGNATGSATAAGNGGTAPYSFVWANGQTGATATGLPAGQHCVTVSDANACFSVACVTITQPTQALTATTAVTTNYGGSDISCNGATDGGVSANPIGGTPNYSYNWTGGFNTQTVTGLAAGTYNVTVTDANGCTTTSSVTLTQPALVTATIASQVNVACFGQATGTATAAGNGGTGGTYTFIWTNGQNTATATGLTVGQHCVTVTDVNGCANSICITVTQPASALSTTASVTSNYNGANISCFNAADGSVAANPVGGTFPYTYLWTGGAGTQTVSGLIAGVYTVTVTDANSCTATASVTLTQPTAVTATLASQTNVTCFGTSTGIATVAGTGGTPGYSFNWATGPQFTATATGLAAGVHCVTITDANNCPSSTCVTIIQPATALATNITITSDYNGSQLSCFNSADATATANVTGGNAPFSFSWSVPQTTQNVTGLPAGPVVVIVTDATGCTATANANVVAPVSVTVGVATTGVSCFGGSNGTATATVSGGTGAYSYLWDNTANTASVSGLSAGVVCVTVTDANGCQNAACGNINEPATAVTAVASVISNFNGAQTSCSNSTDGVVQVVPSGGTAPYSFSWSFPGGTSNTLSNVGAGVYFVTVTDANGCSPSTVTSVTVTSPSPVAATVVSSVSVTCNGGSDGEATVAGSGGTVTTDYTYVWNTNPTQTGPTATGLAAGNYVITVTDNNNCFITTNVTINQPLIGVNAVAVVTSNYNGSQVTCPGACDGEATAVGAGGNAPYSFQWSANTGNQATAIATGLCANTVYSVTVTDNIGCSGTTTVTLSNPVQITASISAQTAVSCLGGSNGTATVSVNGGSGSYSFAWSNGSTNATGTGFPAGLHFVTVTDGNGCTATASVIITEPATPLVLNIVNDTLYNGQSISCNGVCDASISIQAVGGVPGYSFSWNNGANTASINNLCPGVYTVTVTDAGGCVQSSSFTVTQPAVLSSAVGTQVNIGCSGDSTGAFTVAALGGTPGYTYNIGNGPVSSNLFNNLPAGSYCVTVSDLNFCTSVVCATITQPATTVTATAGVTQQVTCNNACDGSASVVASGGTAPYTFLWSANSQTTQTATGLCGGSNYAVLVRDANGCEFTTTVSLPNPTVLTASVSSTSNALCDGDASGSATVTANGGTAPYTFSIGTPQANGNFNGLTAGNYVVTVTDNRGCTTTVPFVITAPPVLSITSINITSNYNGTQISCAGACDGAATVVAAGGTGTYTFQWSNGQTTFTATGLCNNGGSVTVTDQNGCQVTGAINGTLTEPSAVSLTVTNQINIGCAGAISGSFEVVATGGTPNYSFFNGISTQANGIYTNLAAGTYCVTVTDQNGCRNSICTTLSQGSPVTLTATVVSDNNGTAISCSNSADGAAEVTPSGGTAPYSFEWSNGQTTALATGLPGGVHCVTVTDVNLCVQTACVTITGPTVLEVSAVSGTVNNASCFGVADGSFTIVASGGTAPYIYSINNGITFTNQVTYNNQAAGTYTIIVRDANGCQDTTFVTITEPSQLNVLLVNENDVTCFGSNNGSVSVSGTGGTAPYTYSFNGGAFTTTNNFVDLIAGTYTVVTQDANGCTATLPITITQPTAILITVNSQVNPTCNLACDGQIVISAVGGNAPYTFSSNGTTFQAGGAFSGLCEGTYPMTVEDAFGCQVSVNVSLTDPSPVTLAVTQTQVVSCFGVADGQATAVAGGGTGAFTYIWQPGGQTTAIATGLLAGTYNVTATDANGCARSAAVTIIQPAALAANVTSQTNPTCFGQTNGAFSVQADPLSGTGPYTYTIGGPVQGNGIFTNLAAGNYTVTVTDARGCNIQVPVVLTQPAAVDAPAAIVTSNYNGSDISCATACDGAATIPNPIVGGTTPYSFLWSNSQTTQSISGLCAGSYRVTITDVNGCQDTTSIVLTAPAQLTASTAINGAGCANGNSGDVTVTATGGTAPYSYSLNGGTAQFANVFSNLTAGTYTIVTTDANGCTVSNTATVGSASAIVINANATSNFAGFNVSCFGSANGTASAAAAGGVAPYSFEWSNGQTTQTASGLAAGIVTVTVTDNNGCSNVANVTISEPAQVNVSIVSSINPICGGGAGTGSVTVSANGGAGTYLYNINGGAFQSGTTFNFLGATTHTVVVQDANGCTDTTTVTLTAPDTLNVTVQVTDVSCFGLTDGTATAVVTGGSSFPNGGFIYNWAPGGQSTQTIGNLSGNINYSVTVQDANGCVAFGSAFIVLPTQLVATVQNITHVDCNGNGNGEITLAVNGSSGTYQYSIDGGLTYQNATSTPIVISGLVGGNYQVVVRDSASQSCEVPLSVEVLENNGLTVGFITVPVACLGDENGTATALASGGEGPYTYIWTNGQTTQTSSGLASNLQDSVFTSAPYFVTVTDVNGCTASSSAIGITSPEELVATDSIISNVSCFAGNDGAAIITVTGGNSAAGYSILWSNGATTAELNGLEEFVYGVTVTDARGCIDTLSVSITEPTFPLVAALSTQDITCFGGTNGVIVVDSIQGGTPGYEFAFEFEGPFGPEEILSAGLPTGVYTVYVRDSNGCVVTVNDLIILEPTEVDVIAYQDQTIRMGESVSVSATVSSTQVDTSLISWYYYDANGAQNVLCQGGNCFEIDVNDIFETTTLIFNLNNGCNDSASVTITVNPTESVFVPNAFTPNGDGMNDVFTVYGSVDVQRVNRLLIFDRWGELVYEATDFPPNDLSNGWDGSFKGKKLNPAVFVFYAEITLVNGEVVTRKGDVTLIR